MSQELFGKWYVYRYNLAAPVLKAPETTLEITGDGSACRARFELKGQAQPVEVAMTAPSSGTGDWLGKTGSFELQWAQLEPGVLTGQIADPENAEGQRDFFVAVRTRRTGELPPKNVYTFKGSYSTPYRKPSGKGTGKDISVNLEKKEIRFEGTIYKMRAKPQSYGRGLKLTGRYRKDRLTSAHDLRLWILPVDETGRLLATGYYEYHVERYNTGSSRPECQTGKAIIS